MPSNYHCRMRAAAWLLPVGFVLAACGTPTESRNSRIADPLDTASSPEPSILPEEPELPSDTVEQAELDPELINPRVEEFESYLPPRLPGLDGIRPVYEPRFVAAADAPLEDEELIIGISLEGDAKAYPITVLRFREIVNDELGGLPILVTW